LEQHLETDDAYVEGIVSYSLLMIYLRIS